MENRRILAERSSWVSARIILWIVTILFFGGSLWMFIESINMPEFLPAFGAAITGFIIFLICSIIYTIITNGVPLILAEFYDGIIYFYPKKNEQIAVKPKEIQFISQKNYSSQFGTYSSGKLEIELFKRQTIALKFVREIDEVRRKLENLKERSIKSAI